MFLNKIIIKRRKELKISQIELAKGVCTQATISKLEKQGLAPSFDILVQLCKRLGLTLNDVFSDFNYEAKEKLQDKIDQSFKLMASYHFDKSEKIINSINEEEAQENNLLGFLYFLKGNLALNYKKDFDEAQFFFNWILEKESNQLITCERLLSLNGLGVIYFQKDKFQLAAYYFDQINNILVLDKKAVNEDKRAVHLLANLANFYASNQNYSKSLQAIKKALETVKNSKDFSYTEQLLYLKAYDLFQIDKQSKEIEKILRQAQAFAQFNENKVVEEHIDYYYQKHIFKAKRTRDNNSKEESSLLSSLN
ncbi:helix-turn-helix transcriptional regulator [Oenococcus sp. UCMA 17063]|nr:helix-turn-helix transcriptional regulator [Oenococcus sp. UCMA 17063]